MVELNNNYHQIAQYQLNNQQQLQAQSKVNSAAKNEEKLEEVAAEFSSIFIEKMFSAMKKTLSDEKMIDGGYAEDVFSDMLYREYSQMAGKQGMLTELNQALVEQLKNS
ncbi:flagellar protein FlgJ [Halanaerobium saccharolyticum]|uniref:Flagellar protein FlgJ n=1 Tax=Halanaerobium saccharolyticum TaxID=43595 RepID=A0A4R7YMS6_9FIRM|nr:rod-binding protein [Halanaerobium saccharolyticum]RAK08926.1 flagellar protein FlgJ [Halanaerobium saccharolyticum]TDV98966.1 flagellar protein FlgJ [Halanaerobium saccharolyticum]TDX60689.1 flagellar protein FlgJ [Halanaerobium saccharolyticum]